MCMHIISEYFQLLPATQDYIYLNVICRFNATSIYTDVVICFRPIEPSLHRYIADCLHDICQRLPPEEKTDSVLDSGSLHQTMEQIHSTTLLGRFTCKHTIHNKFNYVFFLCSLIYIYMAIYIWQY